MRLHSFHYDNTAAKSPNAILRLFKQLNTLYVIFLWDLVPPKTLLYVAMVAREVVVGM